jgi:hypothetical protein
MKDENKRTMDLTDAYKSALFGVRTVFAAATGRVIGGIDTDDAVGKALCELQDPRELAARDPVIGLVMHALAGMWQVLGHPANRLSSHPKPEGPREKKEVVKDDLQQV